MHSALSTLDVSTPGRGFVDLTGRLRDFLQAHGCGEGLLTVFVRHTSASLLVQENADPTVRADLERFFARLVPDGEPLFRHDDEGPDDMPAHVRSALTQTSVGLPVQGAGCCSAPGRRSTSGSTGTRRTTARWSASSSARAADGLGIVRAPS